MIFDPTSIRLLEDRILVRRVDRGEHISRGGVLIPDTAQELGDCAEVIVVGPGTLEEDGSRIPLDTTPGDTVIINRYAGTELNVNGDSYLVLRDRDVLARVDDSEKVSA